LEVLVSLKTENIPFIVSQKVVGWFFQDKGADEIDIG
jgi:hypothetical protein